MCRQHITHGTIWSLLTNSQLPWVTLRLLQSPHKRAGTLLASELWAFEECQYVFGKKKKILSTYNRLAPHEEREQGLYEIIRGPDRSHAQERLSPFLGHAHQALPGNTRWNQRFQNGEPARGHNSGTFSSDCSPPEV